jgi:hypothetical protein
VPEVRDARTTGTDGREHDKLRLPQVRCAVDGDTLSNHGAEQVGKRDAQSSVIGTGSIGPSAQSVSFQPETMASTSWQTGQ